MIDLPPEQLATVRRILNEQVPECEVCAFGSRVNGTPKPYSDLDLIVIGPERLSLGRMAALREAFEESDLPIRVDVLDWHATSENFQQVIDVKFEVVVQRPSADGAGA